MLLAAPRKVPELRFSPPRAAARPRRHCMWRPAI